MNNGAVKQSLPSLPDTPRDGSTHKAAFEKAAALLKAGDVAGALAVDLLPSDRDVIEKRIAAKSFDSDVQGEMK
jgi:biotin synthase-related radical SAM superfamily protein